MCQSHRLGAGRAAVSICPKAVLHCLEFPTVGRWLLIGSEGYDLSGGQLYSAFARGLKGADVYAEIKNVGFVND